MTNGHRFECAECIAREAELRDALHRVRDLCTYSSSRVPRYVITSGKEIVRVIDEALGAEGSEKE